MNIKKNIYYFLLVLPILDLITALITRNSSLLLTPGTIVKGLLLIIIILYIIYTNSKYGKTSKITLILFFVYGLSYFYLKPLLLNKAYFFAEITYLFKLFFYPIMFLGLLCLYDENNFDSKKMIKILSISLLIYTILLLIPYISGEAYNTYHSFFKGKIGWFYSGNEISNILVLLLASSFYFIEYFKKNVYLIFIPILFIIFQIGTKVSFLGSIIVILLFILFKSISSIKTESIKFLKYIFITLLVIFYAYFSPTIYNYNYELKHEVPIIENPIVIDDVNKYEVEQIQNQMQSFFDSNKINLIFKKLLSSRDIYLANTISIYNNDLNSNYVLFGIGFSNTEEINNPNIAKLIEIDVLDGFFHYGVIGLLIMLSPFIFTLYLIIKSRNKITLMSVYYALIILLVLGISTFSGHVLTAPSVSIYLVLYLLLLLNEFKVMGRNYELENKISILSLHLGYGGIERAVVNQANILCEKYDVEIICLYKVLDKIPYKIDKRVKVIYLSNLKPNKEEFLKYYNQRNIFKTIKEGFKSVYILFKKHSLIKSYIYDSDSKIIISTRLGFTKLLNNYGYKETVKIAEEHVYHNNDQKYFKKLKRSLKNIDYLLPTSKYLTNDYKKIMADEQVKVIYIPNIISDIPKSSNSLNNNSIISVGRLSPEKGYVDLIDVFKIVHNKNKNIKLTLVGDGPEKNIINHKIQKYKLSKNIKLTGFLNQEDLKKEYRKASLFVMTSLEESFGLVLIEAMSYGIPCIAFDSALGATEIINEKNGTLIANRDTEKMAASILDYFDRNKIKMSEASKKTSSEYTFDKVKVKWYDLIDKIINN